MSYSNPANFCAYWGLPPTALSDIPDFDPTAYQNASATRIDSYFRTGGYDVPIPEASVTDEIRRWEDILTAWDILNFWGFDALAQNNETIKERYDGVIKELRDVAAKKLFPIPLSATGETQDADPTNDPGGYVVLSDARRGW